MTLLFCLPCALIVDVPDGVERVCPKCGQALVITNDDDKFDERPSWMLLASRAVHGKAPRIRRRWEVV